MQSTLSNEIQVFDQHRAEWMQAHQGKFVAIRDSEIAEGFFATYEEALKAGLGKFGVTRPFLVKQISGTEPVYFVS